MSYTVPIEDLKFALQVHANLNTILALPNFTDLDQETVNAILEEAAKFAENEWSTSNRKGDINGAKFKNGTVESDPSIKNTFNAFREAGWSSLTNPIEFGGQGLPLAVSSACEEMWYAGNVALSLLPMLTNGAIFAIKLHASEELKHKFLPKMCDMTWAGTMNLTEPQAGSDLSQITTKAKLLNDDSYAISGQKIFITWGEHDLTENIIHLVLARLPDAPAGVKGISLFLVPKFLLNDDGSLAERNTVELVSIEHKLGIHASPTCVLQFNEATGYLVGQAGLGLSYMFTMMNHARLSVGIEGHAISDIAFQYARNYANERIQSKDITSKENKPVTIIHHDDVRRMLLIQKATLAAQRALYMFTAGQLDLAEHHPDESQRQQSSQIVNFMIPIIKAFCTENSTTLTNLAIQVFGGMGYIEETGVAQFMRDARITPIYEGTNGIQAIDLIGRKTAKNKGLVATEILNQSNQLVESLKQVGADKIAVLLQQATDLAKDSVAFIVAYFNSDKIAYATTGAFPFLMQISTTIGAIELSKAYLVAVNGLKNPLESDFSALFYQNKLATIGVYFDHILPNIYTYQMQLKNGADSILNIAVENI